MSYPAHAGVSSTMHRPMVQSLRILRLLVSRSGTYNQPYFRPYQTHYDVETADLLNRRLEAHGPGSTTSAVLSGIANRIMMPSAQHQGPIPIVNGWAEARGRFNMVVEVTMSSGTVLFYHIQGYTSHYDQSTHGTPDPNMTFYVNSYTRTSRIQYMGPTGVETRESVTESAQVINGRLVTSQIGQDLYGIRPTELYTIMQGDLINAEFYTGDERDTVYDRRHSLATQAVPSNRSNNLPSNMLATLVESYNTAQLMSDYGQSRTDMISQCKGYVHDGTLQSNPFFRRLADVTGIPETTAFTMQELAAIDPNVSAVSTFVRLDARGMAQLNHAGQAEYWHRPDDMNAWVCTVLLNAVPTILMEMMLTRIEFTANNHDSMGNNHVYITGARDILGRDITTNLEAFKLRFTREIMHDVTYGNAETYMLSMSVNLFGDTVIDIAYGANPMTRFVVPSFCDSLLIPVVTTDERILRASAHDISQILHGINAHKPAAVNRTI